MQTVKLGTTIGNIGLEGVTSIRRPADFIFVKEKEPEGIFQTAIDLAAGTATNGSPTTDESDQSLRPGAGQHARLLRRLRSVESAVADGRSRSYDQLLIISQESGQIVNVDRSGSVYSTG